jgi:hypothetical protein
MPYEVKWMYENHLVYDRLFGDVTIQDAAETSQLLEQHLSEGHQAGAPLVHIIVDMSEATSTPFNLREIHQVMTHLKHPALGWTAVLGPSKLVGMLASLITQLFKARYRTFQSIDEAVAFLKTQDQQLAAAVDLENVS